MVKILQDCDDHHIQSNMKKITENPRTPLPSEKFNSSYTANSAKIFPAKGLGMSIILL